MPACQDSEAETNPSVVDCLDRSILVTKDKGLQEYLGEVRLCVGLLLLSQTHVEGGCAFFC